VLPRRGVVELEVFEKAKRAVDLRGPPHGATVRAVFSITE
jgi:hypothetical protein